MGRRHLVPLKKLFHLRAFIPSVNTDGVTAPVPPDLPAGDASYRASQSQAGSTPGDRKAKASSGVDVDSAQRDVRVHGKKPTNTFQKRSRRFKLTHPMEPEQFLKCIGNLKYSHDPMSRGMFEQEGITADKGNELVLTIISAIVQEENESRSRNTQWGIKKKAADGTSKLYRRKCYGYRENAEGILEIVPEQAEAVRLIFDLYLQGYSFDMIRKVLLEKGIPSPTGRESWSKKTISATLENEKYCGHVILMKTIRATGVDFRRVKNRGQQERYQLMNNHPAIISDKIFERVQEEKKRRSNMIETETGYQRKNTHYSAKRDMGE